MKKRIRIIIFGIGGTCEFYLKHIYNNDFHIVGLSDWDTSKHGTQLYGYEVINPYKFENYDYDFILIMSVAVEQIKNQLLERCQISSEKIRMLSKYFIRQSDWTIGVFNSTDRFVFSEVTQNPIITKKDVENLNPISAADPFVFYENNTYYCFFEVLVIDNMGEKKGEINLATSNDGINFTQKGTVLEENKSISFPIVYKHDNEYYMTVHSVRTKDVRLFKAKAFPYQWEQVATLLNGSFRDPVLYLLDSTWYLFTSTKENAHLFYSKNLLGPYKEHNQSPIVKNNSRIARNAGNIFSVNGRLYRPVQDTEKVYGDKVRLMEVLKIDKYEYLERECDFSPILEAGNDPWRSYRMHTFNIYDVKDDGSFKFITDGDNINSQAARTIVPKNIEQLGIKTLTQ